VMIFLEIGVFVVMEESSLWYSGCGWETGTRPFQTWKGEENGSCNTVIECFD
jgi:hypothetical protein